jgi:hypothetical protein
MLPHLMVPPTQSRAHTPLVQTSPALQALSQDPQWSWSLVVFAHTLPQAVVPSAQMAASV